MAAEYSSELRIPKERVAVLIGTKGATKRSIEKKTGTRISLSKEGDTIVSGSDNVGIYFTSLIVRAIGRGFNPKTALLLLDEENSLEVINIKDFTKGSKKKMLRMKSRIIGTKGKARIMLEALTDTSISVYGRTVAVIGKIDKVLIAKNAVEKILHGSPHGNVYHYIESQKKSQDL